MPPNLRGGKKYKSSKHQDLEVKLVERDSDQMYGRVIRLLGQRNVMVYCNDNKQRICHICGAMKQRVWINPGDLVILSLRSLQLRQGDSFSTQDMRGDIVAKVDSRTISKIRRSDPDFNPLLLTMVESTDEKDLAQKVKNHGKGDEEDDLFDRSSDDGVEGGGEEGEEISEEEGGDSNEMKKAKLRSFDEKSKVRDAKRSEARGMKQSGDMDRELTEKDIDAI